MIRNYQSKYLGEINLEKDDFYSVEIEVDNKARKILLEIEENSFSIESVKAIDFFLEKFTENESLIKSQIVQELDKVSFVRDYIELIKNDFKKAIERLIQDTNANIKLEKRLFNKLYICQVSFCINLEENSFAIIDFTIDETLTNDVLVVGINAKNEVNYLTIES